MNKISPEKAIVLLLIVCIFMYGYTTINSSVESYVNSDYAQVMSKLYDVNKAVSLEDADTKVLAYEEVPEDVKPEQAVIEEEELDEPHSDKCIKDDDYAFIFKHKILDPYVYKD
jgi:hypothetical protein